MKIILRERNKYILRFDLGEELIGQLKTFCEKEKIQGGFFSGIGATSSAVISFYNLKEKKFIDNKINKNLEISFLSGNIVVNDDIIIHSHGILSDEKGVCMGGHIKEIVVAATCEIFLERFKNKLEREFNNKIGLKIIK